MARSQKELTFERFQRLDPERKPAPLVIALGDEPYFKERIARELAGAMPGAERVDIQARKRGQDPAEVLDELRSASLFSPEKLVVVRDAEPLVQAAGDAILAYAEAAPRGRCLVLDLRKLDGRTRLAKRAAAHGHIVRCKRLYAEAPPWHRGPRWDTDLARWTARRIEEHGRRIRPEVAYHLTELTGDDLFEIDATIEKLTLLLGERREVTPEDLDAVAARTRRGSAFAIAEAVASRDGGRALALIRQAFERGIEAGGDTVSAGDGIGIVVFGAIHRTFRELRRVRAHLAKGGSRDERAIARDLGIAPYAVPRALSHVRAFEGVSLARCYRALLACDLGLKGRMRPRPALERLALELCARKAP